MNVLICNPYLEAVGGTEQRILALAAEFRKRGHKTSFLVFGEPGSGHDYGDYTVYKTTSNMSRTIASKIIERDKIDIVQQHNYQNVGNGAILAAEHAKILSVYYAHDFCSICVRRFLFNGLSPDVEPCKCSDPYNPDVGTYERHVLASETAILEHATLGIAPSQYFIDTLEAHDVLKGKWRKVTPWINPYFRDFFWSGYTANTILFCGNLTPGKGVYSLIRALPKILEEIPDVMLKCFAGGPPEGIVLESRKLKVGDHVQLFHPVPAEQLVFEYVNAGFVAFPSRLAEAFGLVWAEAMTVGAPVLCSAVGSIPELSEGKIPLLQKPEDWAEAILTVFQDRQEAVKLAKENKVWAKETFNVEKAADQILKIYEELK